MVPWSPIAEHDEASKQAVRQKEPLRPTEENHFYTSDRSRERQTSTIPLESKTPRFVAYTT